MGIRWQSDGDQMAIRWQSDGNQMAIRWQSDGEHLRSESSWCVFIAAMLSIDATLLASRASFRATSASMFVFSMRVASSASAASRPPSASSRLSSETVSSRLSSFISASSPAGEIW